MTGDDDDDDDDGVVSEKEGTFSVNAPAESRQREREKSTEKQTNMQYVTLLAVITLAQ